MQQLKNGDYVLKPNEMGVLCWLISSHDSDPREHIQNAIRENYGEDSVEEYLTLFAMERIMGELGIGCGESFDYVSVFERKPQTENQLLARNRYKESLTN